MSEIDQLAPNLEKTILGELLLDPHLAVQYVGRLRVDYFTTYNHQMAFRGMLDLISQGKEADELLLSEWIVAHEKASLEEEQKTALERRNEVAYELFNLKDAVVTTAYLEEHIDQLRRDYVRNKVCKIGQDLQKDAKDPTNDPDSLPERAMEKLRNLIAERPWENVFCTQPEVAESAMKEREESLKRMGEDGVTGIPTGIESLDRRTGGWQSDEFIVIGGRNGEGKTWFMVWFMLQAARHGDPCLAFSLEMTNEELYARELMALTSLSSDDYYHRKLTSDQQLEVDVVRKKLDTYPITYMDENEYDIDKLCAMTRELHQKGQCEILFVDYAQIIPASEQKRYFEKRVDVVTYITAKLKNIAKELHIPVIALAQLNRDTEKNEDSRPKKSDLRESGSLEHDADRIYLIWRPELHEKKQLLIHGEPESTKNLIVFIEAKNRKFGNATYYLTVNSKFTKIAEMIH